MSLLMDERWAERWAERPLSPTFSSPFNPESNLWFIPPLPHIPSPDAAYSKHTAGSVCFEEWFQSSGWKASGTDLKSEAISYLIGWHAELSVDFSYRGKQGDNGKCVSNVLGCRAQRKVWRDGHENCTIHQQLCAFKVKNVSHFILQRHNCNDFFSEKMWIKKINQPGCIILWNKSDILGGKPGWLGLWRWGEAGCQYNPPDWSHWWVSWFKCCNLVWLGSSEMSCALPGERMRAEDRKTRQQISPADRVRAVWYFLSPIYQGVADGLRSVSNMKCSRLN